MRSISSPFASIGNIKAARRWHNALGLRYPSVRHTSVGVSFRAVGTARRLKAAEQWNKQQERTARFRERSHVCFRFQPRRQQARLILCLRRHPCWKLSLRGLPAINPAQVYLTAIKKKRRRYRPAWLPSASLLLKTPECNKRHGKESGKWKSDPALSSSSPSSLYPPTPHPHSHTNQTLVILCDTGFLLPISQSGNKGALCRLGAISLTAQVTGCAEIVGGPADEKQERKVIFARVPGRDGAAGEPRR